MLAPSTTLVPSLVLAKNEKGLPCRGNGVRSMGCANVRLVGRLEAAEAQGSKLTVPRGSCSETKKWCCQHSAIRDTHSRDKLLSLAARTFVPAPTSFSVLPL